MSTQEYGRPDDSVDVSDEIAGAVVASDATLHEANKAAHQVARAALEYEREEPAAVEQWPELEAALSRYRVALRRVSPGRTEEGE